MAQIALHRCTTLGRACAECCLARDPYCAWDGSACTRFQPTAKRWAGLESGLGHWEGGVTYCSATSREGFTGFNISLRRFRRQDVRNGDPSTLCSGGEYPINSYAQALKLPHPALPCLNFTFLSQDSSHPALLERKVLGVENGSAFLECEPRSLQAHVEWTFHRAGEVAHTQVCLPPPFLNRPI